MRIYFFFGEKSDTSEVLWYCTEVDGEVGKNDSGRKTGETTSPVRFSVSGDFIS